MLKQGTFIRKKFTSLLICSLWGALAVGLNYMLDSVLGGNQLGEDALTAISIVTPLYFITNFLILLLAPGYGMIYGKYNGAFENEKSYEVAGQSIISSIGTGLIILIFLLILNEPYLRYYECTGKIYEYASIYYKWTIYSTAPAPIALSLFYLILEDADTLIMTLSGAVKMVINAILSILLCKPLGIAGLGLATFLGGVAALLVLLSHFFKKTCSIHFRFYFNWGMLKEALTLSSSIFFSYLFIGLVDIIMNKVILVYCGLSMIAAYSVINLAFSCYEIYDCIYYSCGGFIATFLGEKNSLGIKTTLKVSVKATCILGLCLSAILLIIAPYIPDLYGMTTPDVIDASIISAKIMAIASIPYGIAYAAICTFPALGRAKSGFLISVLNDLICPLLLSIPLCILTGFNGVAIGMALSSYLVWIIFALVEIKKYGKHGFPLYLEDYREEVVSFENHVCNETPVLIRDKVKAELDSRGYDVQNIELLIEELYIRILEKNPGKKIMAQCDLLFGEDYVRIIVRDDGVIFNFVDENNKIESLNAYVLNTLLEQTEFKEYSLTTSFNRNGFVFNKQLT